MWDEAAIDYLLHSTTPTARAVREFLNRSLSCFPRGHANSLAKRLKYDWQAHFFEIVVGRYLQLLGAEVQPEPKGTNGTHVDFRATFSDGVISVECLSKRYNKEANDELRRQGRLTQLIEDAGPVGWILVIGHLPSIGPIEDFEPFLEVAKSWFARLPRPEKDGRRERFSFDQGDQRLEFDAVPAPSVLRPAFIGPSVAFNDDSVERLKDALTDEHKRQQARGAQSPVFLAIDAPTGGPDHEAFDEVLFGQQVSRLKSRRELELAFDPNGKLVMDENIPFAGVIAFPGMRMDSAREPTLYLNPHQDWQLPAAIVGLGRRELISQIEASPSSETPDINDIGFVNYGD